MAKVREVLFDLMRELGSEDLWECRLHRGAYASKLPARFRVHPVSPGVRIDKEKFDLIENIQHVINDFGNESSNEKIQLLFTQPPEPIFINADKVRISEVISNC